MDAVYVDKKDFQLMWTSWSDDKSIVAYLLKARTVEPQKQPLQSNTHMQQQNNGVMQPISRQRLSKHTSAQVQ
jgi:hypothetical protein